MKTRLKDWVTNLFAVVIWAASIYLFVIDKLDTDKFIILIVIGFVFLFMDHKEILVLAKKFLKTKIK